MAEAASESIALLAGIDEIESVGFDLGAVLNTEAVAIVGAVFDEADSSEDLEVALRAGLAIGCVGEVPEHDDRDKGGHEEDGAKGEAAA